LHLPDKNSERTFPQELLKRGSIYRINLEYARFAPRGGRKQCRTAKPPACRYRQAGMREISESSHYKCSFASRKENIKVIAGKIGGGFSAVTISVRN
jgi:hypothetical protein